LFLKDKKGPTSCWAHPSKNCQGAQVLPYPTGKNEVIWISKVDGGRFLKTSTIRQIKASFFSFLDGISPTFHEKSICFTEN
jgi:hypothetical protein